MTHRADPVAVPPPSPPQDPPPPPAAEVVDDRPHDGRTVRGAVLWSYLLGGGQMVLHGGVTLLLAAILLPEVFGVMALALTWVTFAQMLLHEGPALAVIQRADVNDRHLTAAFVVNLITAALIATVFVAVAPLWAAAVKLPELTWLCWALAPVILLHALIVVPDAILRRQMRMRRLQARLLHGHRGQQRGGGGGGAGGAGGVGAGAATPDRRCPERGAAVGQLPLAAPAGADPAGATGPAPVLSAVDIGLSSRIHQ